MCFANVVQMRLNLFRIAGFMFKSLNTRKWSEMESVVGVHSSETLGKKLCFVETIYFLSGCVSL